MKKPVTLFDHLIAITQEQDPDYWSKLDSQDKKSFSTYMINRFLSMNPDWVEYVNEVQHMSQVMEPEIVYKLYINSIPKSRSFLKYIKSSTKTIFEDWLVDLVSTSSNVSKDLAIEYLKIYYASDNGRIAIKEICQMYGIDPKKIKKLKL